MMVKLAVGVLTSTILILGFACSGEETTPVPPTPEPQTLIETATPPIPTSLPTATGTSIPTPTATTTGESVAQPTAVPTPTPEQVNLRTLPDNLVQIAIGLSNRGPSGSLQVILGSQAVDADANEITVSVDGEEYCNPVQVGSDLEFFVLSCGNSIKKHFEVQEVFVSVRNQGEMRCDRHRMSDPANTLFACIWETDTEGNPIPFVMEVDPTATLTPTPTPEPTATPSPTPAPTATPTPTITPTPELASQIVPTSVPSPTFTPIPTPTPISLGLSQENPWPMDGTCLGPEDGFCVSVVSVNGNADIDWELRADHKFVLIEINALNQSDDLLDSSDVGYLLIVIGQGKNVDVSQGDNGGCGWQTVPNKFDTDIDVYPGDSLSGNVCFVVHEDDVDTLVLRWFDALPILWYTLH